MKNGTKTLVSLLPYWYHKRIPGSLPGANKGTNMAMPHQWETKIQYDLDSTDLPSLLTAFVDDVCAISLDSPQSIQDECDPLWQHMLDGFCALADDVGNGDEQLDALFGYARAFATWHRFSVEQCCMVQDSWDWVIR
ncbi:hypothetical protein E0E52_14530 [Azotobacter chroococcum]|uniref:hypothetical protein n=1 Tax=Azotobacter chroococcum TaxID=353 RepID=UPI00103F5237|nr:hypothetical protein [Azotobacter chroococcum]TBW03703.1 hypothetical protein E0E52_14530 [Azotobacter chroococcum]